MSALGEGQTPSGVGPTGGVTGHADVGRARRGAAMVLRHLVRLYTAGEASSVSAAELARLAESMLYVLGADSLDDPAAVCVLARSDAVGAYESRRRALDERARATGELWGEVALAMPRIPNRALVETMASVHDVLSRYDTHFSAHLVPAELTYVPHGFEAHRLAGIDAVEAWLRATLDEARWLSQFDLRSLIGVLEAHAPGYLDDCASLRDLVEPHVDELPPR
ncbi:MAG: DUF6179 domain-containing protein [Parafannyhessea sp.]|uniref:DUF6179 domain-containing protein n=1 Tax=Parafannyhessea sp. TaxID=2847324 RepID=UPI003F00E1DF